MTRDALLTHWTEIGDKIVGLAEEFPEDRYDFRPTSDVRSFADQLRHVAFWNTHVHKTLRGEAADGQGNELPRATYPTKQKIVAALQDTSEAVKAELAKGRVSLDDASQKLLLAFIEHSGEHYGQLVVYARLNDVVPPASLGE